MFVGYYCLPSLSLEFTGEMELDVFEILLRHLKHIVAVGQKHVTAFAVLRHVLVLAFLEIVELNLVITLYPASLVQVGGLPTAKRIVFILQSVLNHLELQLPHCTNDLAVVKLVDKQLGHALVHQLLNTLVELLGLHRVSILDVLEHLWRETRQSAEMKHLTLSQSVPNLEDTIVGQADNVARIGFLYRTLALRHKLSG